MAGTDGACEISRLVKSHERICEITQGFKATTTGAEEEM